LLSEDTHAFTQVLTELQNGDGAAANRLLPIVYDELRGIAAKWFARPTPGMTLQPTALVHEAFLHLVDQTQVDWKNRSHFFAVAATAMRQILIQHARQRNAAKRGGDWQRITLSQAAAVSPKNDIDVLDLDEALTRLGQLHARQGRVVELRFFAELKNDEVAEVLNVSPRTVELDWRAARAWLRSTLVDGEIS
jgi:RNA polymerase sigma-70 factor (ECF subfamily)